MSALAATLAQLIDEERRATGARLSAGAAEDRLALDRALAGLKAPSAARLRSSEDASPLRLGTVRSRFQQHRSR